MISSFQNIKIDFVPRENGGIDIIFNDGDYIRLGGERWTNDYGRININNAFTELSTMFSEWNPMYVKMTYKSSAGIPAQFTINKVNGITASQASESTPIEVTDGIYQLYGDLKFENGFKVRNMGGAEKDSPIVGYLNYGDSSLIPEWNIAQWDTKYDFRDLENDTMFMEMDDGVYVYDSIDKVLTVDTNTGEIGLQLNASEVYDAPRVDFQAWPHLLLERSKTRNEEAPYANQLKNVNHLRLQFSQKLTMFEDHMGDTATGLHAGSFYTYLLLKGINDKGQNELLWFGLPLFDNRYAYLEETSLVDGGKADASGNYIYLIPSRAFTNTDFLKNGEIYASDDNEWMTIDIDVLPYIKRALTVAQEAGYMQGVTMDTVYVDGMNIGWEMPGTYDGEMKIKDISLLSYVGTTYESNNGFYNFLVSDMEEKENVTVDESLTMTVPKNLLSIDDYDKSMLIIQSAKRDSVEGVAVAGRKVTEVYDVKSYVNGASYVLDFDNNMELVYKATSGNISDLKFYTVRKNGKTDLIEGTYDVDSNTFRFVLEQASDIAVTVEQDSSGTTSDGETTLDADNNNNSAQSPQTGDMVNSMHILCLVVSLIGSICLVFIRIKKRA